MAGTLSQILLMNMGLTGCLQSDIGLLNQVKVFDVSFNKLVGTLPDSIGEMKMLEQLNVAHNKLSGEIPESICLLPKLENFTYSYNYFCSEPHVCLKLSAKDDRKNCIPYRPLQRSPEECKAFYAYPVKSLYKSYDTMEEALHAFNHANNLPMNSYRGGDGMSLVASSGISTTLGNEEPCQQYLSTINMESKKSLMFGKEDPREESPSISNLQLRNMESKKLDYSAFFYGFVAGIILGVLFGCYLM
ncbi:hypothetical protein GH714_032895 [Hevea brasiliensis]|uniref:Leucine-rich repeat-containing N-terminal plant-type domain-containing protein n=1 Tax=Hevea brasiliensis TaxID=3981 RepID=A0A6A6LSU0_HEVBR|nr:hypothetical protein GH714_032895 [Hevea brasiliensis]